MITKHRVSVRAVSVTVLLVNLSACAVSDEVDNPTIELADKLATNGGGTSTPANPTSEPEPNDTAPTSTVMPPATAPTMTGAMPTTSVDEPPPEGDAGTTSGGSGGAGGDMSMGGAGGTGGAGGSGGGPLMPEGDPPASMTWETCEPIWATHFCPELDCETTTLCTDGDAQYEPNCRTWCSQMMECVSANPDCVEEEDPLCISSYSPRDKCIDALEMTNNYSGSWGSKAAIALLECACGAAN